MCQSDRHFLVFSDTTRNERLHKSIKTMGYEVILIAHFLLWVTLWVTNEGSPENVLQVEI